MTATRPLVLAAGALLVAGTTLVAAPAFAAHTCSITVTGNPAAGETLTSHVTYDGTPMGYSVQWYRGAADDSESVGNTYQPVDGDVGSTLRVYASVVYSVGFPPDGCGATVTTPVITRLATDVPTPPTLTGEARKGKTLTATSNAPAGTTASYQWFRVVKKKHHAPVPRAIAGATSPTYKVKGKDVGRKVQVVLTYTQAHRTPVTRTLTKRVR